MTLCEFSMFSTFVICIHQQGQAGASCEFKSHSKRLEHSLVYLIQTLLVIEYITSALPLLEDESDIDVELNSKITCEEFT